jgi:hypothetical protein
VVKLIILFDAVPIYPALNQFFRHLVRLGRCLCLHLLPDVDSFRVFLEVPVLRALGVFTQHRGLDVAFYALFVDFVDLVLLAFDLVFDFLKLMGKFAKLRSHGCDLVLDSFGVGAGSVG